MSRGRVTAPTCSLVIANPNVSREHVELGIVPEGVTARDLKSRNGYLQQRVQRAAVGRVNAARRERAP